MGTEEMFSKHIGVQGPELSAVPRALLVPKRVMA